MTKVVWRTLFKTLFQVLIWRWVLSTTFLDFYSSHDNLVFWVSMKAVIYGMKKLTRNCKTIFHHLTVKFHVKNFFCNAFKLGLSFVKKKPQKNHLKLNILKTKRLHVQDFTQILDVTSFFLYIFFFFFIGCFWVFWSRHNFVTNTIFQL